MHHRPGTLNELSHDAFTCRWEPNPTLCLDMWNAQHKLLLYTCTEAAANQHFFVDSHGRWHSNQDAQCLTADGTGATLCNDIVPAAPLSQRIYLADLKPPRGMATPPPVPPAPRDPPHSKNEPMNPMSCKRMLRDETHIFRRMWAADAWGKMFHDNQVRPACWNTNRIREWGWKKEWLDTDTFFEETARGKWCESNWYEDGSQSEMGRPGQKHPPYFQKDHVAPAAFGFDETIDQHCAAELAKFGKWPDHNPAAHALNCQKANVNILALYGQRLPYNLCRNLEWMTCAAQGKLAGQMNQPEVIFAKAPGELYPGGRSGKPIGECCGWAPDTPPDGGFGYTTDDIFYLEVCLFNEMCENGASIFGVAANGRFRCDFSMDRFRRLENILRAGIKEPDHTKQCWQHRRCQERHDANTVVYDQNKINWQPH